MIQSKTLDDFKNQKIPSYYNASKPKKIPLEVQNEKILEHLRTHTIYKICAFIFVFYHSFFFFNYLKFSRFLKISKANFDAEKRQKIRDTIIENEYWIKQLLKKQGEILKYAAEKAKKLEMWKLQSWYDYFFKYNPNLNVWQNNFLQA